MSWICNSCQVTMTVQPKHFGLCKTCYFTPTIVKKYREQAKEGTPVVATPAPLPTPLDDFSCCDVVKPTQSLASVAPSLSDILVSPKVKEEILSLVRNNKVVTQAFSVFPLNPCAEISLSGEVPCRMPPAVPPLSCGEWADYVRFHPEGTRANLQLRCYVFRLDSHKLHMVEKYQSPGGQESVQVRQLMMSDNFFEAVKEALDRPLTSVTVFTDPYVYANKCARLNCFGRSEDLQAVQAAQQSDHEPQPFVRRPRTVAPGSPGLPDVAFVRDELSRMNPLQMKNLLKYLYRDDPDAFERLYASAQEVIRATIPEPLRYFAGEKIIDLI